MDLVKDENQAHSINDPFPFDKLSMQAYPLYFLRLLFIFLVFDTTFSDSFDSGVTSKLELADGAIADPEVCDKLLNKSAICSGSCFYPSLRSCSHFVFSTFSRSSA